MTMDFVKNNILPLTPAFTRQSESEIKRILKEFRLDLVHPDHEDKNAGFYNVYIVDKFLFAIPIQSQLYEI